MEAAVAAQATPYVIWANFPVDGSAGGDASLVDLVPMVLEQADLPLTAYYETILALHEELPIRTSDNITVSREGIWEAETYGGPRAALLNQYYYMEYNGLVAGDDFMPELFGLD